MPHLQVPRKLKPLFQKKKRYKILIGGRDSAKSTTVADLCLKDSQMYGLKIGCFREFQNSIEDSVHSLLVEEIKRLGINGFNIQKSTISNTDGGLFRFRGLHVNVDSIKSFHGFDRFWIEEGQFLTAESITLITKTLREIDSEFWVTANPMSRGDPFSQRFIVPFERELEKNGYYEDDMHLIIVTNYMDNPFHNEVMEQERLYDLEHMSTAEYEHVWLGKFNDTVPGAIIMADWFDAAIDAHLKLNFEPTGIESVSYDPSDSGVDTKGLCHRHGSVILNIDEMDEGLIDEGTTWALNYAIENQVDAFIWDGDGMGVGLRKQVSDALTGKRITPNMFRGSEGVADPTALYRPVTKGKLDIKGKTNKDTFFNRRAQRYWNLRDRFYYTFLAVTHKKYIDPDELISISSNIDRKILNKFRSEVCRIPRDKNKGKIKILTKEEMKKPPYKLPSPNLADSAMMSEDLPDIANVESFNIDFASPWN